MELIPPARAGTQASQWLTPLRFAALLGLFLLGTFPKVLLGLHSFVYRDYGVLAYPFIHYARESFWRGELPLWNPFSNCGAPFLAQWGTMTLYPFSIIYLLLPLPWSLGFFCLGHLFLGGLGMYFLARRWTEDNFAASIAGLAFVFNGVTLSSLMWPNYTVALGWMPWVIAFAERAWQQGGRNIILTALLGALQLLAGAPEIAAFTWLIAVLFWAGCWITQDNNWKTMVGRLAPALLLIGGLIAVQLLPFLDLLAHSQRDRSFATAKWALPGWGWANLLVPLFHCFESYQGPFVQQGQAFFSSCYLGAGLLGLAWIGAWRSRQWRAWALGAVALFGLITALGENGYLYSWIRYLIPWIGVGRYPVKFLILPAFAAPLLAALAIRWWRAQASSDWETGALVFAGVGVFLLAAMGAILCFAFRYPFPFDQWPATWHNAIWRAVFLLAVFGGLMLLPRLVIGLSSISLEAVILLLIGLDITTHTPKFNPTIPAAEFKEKLWPQAQSTPAPSLGQSRVMITPQAEAILLRSTETNLIRDFVAKRLALWSNLNLLEDIPKVNGSSTLQIREESQIESLLYSTNSAAALAGLIDFLAVSQVTSAGNALDWSGRANYCPWVTSPQEAVFASPALTLEQLKSPRFDPRKTVYLPVESKNYVRINPGSEARILSAHFRSDRVEIELESKGRALVVLAQTFYHPWKATVNGRPTPILRANHAFQAVEAPGGRARILLAYKDGKFLAGAIISILSAGVCLVFLTRNRGG